ncbi:hypothetical protein DFR50_12285 [Roseiarcus fermentans]|uniref:Opacity protein-like surface antigen n=1 Tax=Roseiarcus fermentans TaxID=1473586 RepID=A0A366F3N2_9HYPH|nr:hypothetical protein [Roseiarcus fermentans]RBP09248.1 hypothetical protein DFR50_12285 [Roseiarcus fermentans]
MRDLCLAVAAVTALVAGSAEAADLSQPAAAPVLVTPNPWSMPNSAFFAGLGASANAVHFGSQDVYAIGTSNVYQNGVLVDYGSAQGPAKISMNSKFAFAPSLQAGYYQRFGASDWLWGAKLTYNYLGATSTNNNSIIPQFGSFTNVSNGVSVPFSGPAYVRAAQTTIVQEIDLIPFLGHSFGRTMVYAGLGPTLSQTRTQLNGLVGLADIGGSIVDQSGAPQNFSNYSWVIGGAAMVGATYFLGSGWFIDVNYSYAVTSRHTANFASPFTNPNGSTTSLGTLVGSSAWRPSTQVVSLTINRAF